MRSSQLFSSVCVLTLLGCGGAHGTDPAENDDTGSTSGPLPASTEASTIVAAIQSRFLRPTIALEPGAKNALAPKPVVADGVVDRFDRDGGRVHPVVAQSAKQGVPRTATIELPMRASDAVAIEDDATKVAVRFTLEHAHPAELKVGNGIAWFHGALDGADVLHRVHAEGTEDFVVFEQKPARESLEYRVDVTRVAGLRLVSNTLELLDDSGTPRLRVAPPWVLEASGKRHDATLAVRGCAYDIDTAAPWGRALTKPGAASCSVAVTWSGVHYPAIVDPAWTTTGSMISPRRGYTMTLLNSGKVLLAGGSDGTVITSTAELFDGTSAFAATGSMKNGGRQSHAAALVGGKVLVVGGYYTGAVYRSAAELFDGTGTFTATDSMSTPRAHPTATLLPSGKVLITGGSPSDGSGTTGFLSTAELFTLSGSTGTFAATGSMNVGRRKHQATLLGNGKVLITGGDRENDTYNSSAQLFTENTTGPSYGSFATTGSMKSTRRDHVAVLLKSGKVLIAGGFNGVQLSTAELFSTSSFTLTDSMATPRELANGTLLGSGKVLINGGYSGSSTQLSAELFDGVSLFGTVASMAQRRREAEAVLLPSGKVLAAGGDYTSVLSHAEVFGVAKGLSCTSNDECVATGAGYCVDGVCCDAPCIGQCEACNVTGNLGVCVAVVGAPHGSRTACGGSGVCAAQCNGSTRTSCGAYPGSTTICATATCSSVSNSQTPERRCNSAGSCSTATYTACAPYKCGSTACKTTCTSSTDCASGYNCTGSQCVTNGTPGSVCSASSQCASGNCIDGVCCSVSSCAAPLKCNANGLGTCSKPNGVACTGSSECGSQKCVDGVCCNAVCTGQCEACDVSGSVGTCTAVSGAPHGNRTTCGGTGTCAATCNGTVTATCGPFPGASTLCAAASCTAGDAKPNRYCNSAGVCEAETLTKCAPYVCGTGACKAQCAGNSDCAAGYHCDVTTCVTDGALGTVCDQDSECAAGHCVDSVCCAVAECLGGLKCNSNGLGTCAKALGSTCSLASDCGSGFCVDGVCCDQACNGQCEACDVTDKAGTCLAVTGAPHGTVRTACAGTGLCAQACDGTVRTACGSHPGSSTQCGAPVCDAGKATAPSFCNAGACVAGMQKTCGAYECVQGVCNVACDTSADCATGYGCIAGVCTTLGGLGTTCTDDLQCTGGHCTAGLGATKVCCGAASCPSGTACADSSAGAVAGTCVKALGQTCSAASDCASGACVDGYCCDGTCTGQCEACDLAGAPGKCSAISGAPHGTRTVCSNGGGDVCKARTCDGTKDRTQCLGYASGPETECAKPTCSSGQAAEASHCDGAGACRAGSTKTCGNYACDATTCRTTCTIDTDCAAGFRCDTAAKACVPSTATCTADGTSSVSMDKTVTTPCAPFRCNASSGDCHKSCASSDACASGFVCNGGTCVSASTAAGENDDSGGCSVSKARAKRSSAGSSLAMALVLAGLARRSRVSRLRAQRR